VNVHVTTIDTLQFGSASTGAAYLLQAGIPALIESGTAATHDVIRRALGAIEPAYIFVTHIHLDHAGGAGHLARAFPDCKVVAHARAIRHLVDPSRLIDGVQAASPVLFPLYGTPLPIEERQLVAVTGGECFDLGAGRRIDVVAAPGHAAHHVCFFERTSRLLFAGDAVGHWHVKPDVPLTVPPRFDRTAAHHTLRALRDLQPSQIAFTHFGIAEDATAHLSRYERELDAWFGLVADVLQTHGPEHAADAVLAAATVEHLSAVERAEAAMCVRGAIATLRHEGDVADGR